MTFRNTLLLILLTYSSSDLFAQGDLSKIEGDYIENYVYPDSAHFSHIFPAENNYDFIQDQLSCIENEIPLNYNDRVHSFVNYFAVKKRDFIYKILRRKELYFPTFEKYLAKYDMPDELKYLAVIESGLNASAFSHATAVGLWQFMSYTGRSYGLHHDSFIDERMDFEMATDAACRHLSQLYRMFGDWELAIAAYNTGPGNVRKAMRRSGKRKFWDIYRYLHRETRGYLPQYVAVIYIMNHLEEYNFQIPEDRKFMPEYDTIMIRKFTHIPTLANLLNLCQEDIEVLNPGLKWEVMPELNTPYPLRIPIQAMGTIRENRKAILDSASNVNKDEVMKLARTSAGSTYGKDKVVYRVRSGDVLGLIASRYNVRVSDLRRWNGLSGDMIRVGQRLDIWLKPGSFKPSQNSTVKKVTPKKKLEELTEIDPNGIKTYTVQPGDTLWDISKMFNGVSIERIKSLNQLKSDKIKPGQKLKVG